MPKKKGFTHESQDIVTVEWYTPSWIFECLGIDFNLDPCHPKKRLPWIPVKHVYTIKDNGLVKPWSGRVWLNPPYSNQTGTWLAKMHHHRNGIALVFSRTDCQWYHDYIATSDAILFLEGRVQFVDERGKRRGSGSGCGSLLAAWGSSNVRALRGMKKFDFGHLVEI